MLTATFEPVTNREDWTDLVEVRDANNALFDLTGATIVIAVQERSSKRQVLHATTGNGIVIQDVGVFEFAFPKEQMRGLDASKTYEVGCTIAINGITRQFFIGSVPVLEGIVP